MKTWISMLAIAALTSLVCALLVATKRSSDGGGEANAPALAAPAAHRPPPRAASVEDPWRVEESGLTRDPEVSGGAAEPAKAAPPAPSTDAIRDRMSEVFTSERVDSSWDGAELARLERELPAALPAGSQITRVECRSTMCRIESTHAGVDQFATFARSAFLTEKPINEGPFFASVTAPPVAGQPVTTVAFIARKGHALPMPERIAATP